MLQLEELMGTATTPADTTATDHASSWATLKSMSFDDIIEKLARDFSSFIISIAIAVLVFYIGKYIIRKIYSFTAGLMLRRNVDKSLTTFVLSLIKILLYFILLVTVISILGINTSSFIALFASAGVAIGMALSGTLQNFAGGVLILLLKPYRIGDYIEAQGFAGTVTEIQIFSTIICTPDNKSIIIPNGALSTGTINNWSREDYRRIDWTVSLAYGDSIAKARKAILDILGRNDDIVKEDIPTHRKHLAEMLASETNDNTIADRATDRAAADKIRGANTGGAPTVMLGELSESSINFTVRAWVPASQYWPVYYSVLEAIYNELPKQGLHFPYPQLDVHIAR